MATLPMLYITKTPLFVRFNDLTKVHMHLVLTIIRRIYPIFFSLRFEKLQRNSLVEYTHCKKSLLASHPLGGVAMSFQFYASCNSRRDEWALHIMFEKMQTCTWKPTDQSIIHDRERERGIEFEHLKIDSILK